MFYDQRYLVLRLLKVLSFFAIFFFLYFGSSANLRLILFCWSIWAKFCKSNGDKITCRLQKYIPRIWETGLTVWCFDFEEYFKILCLCWNDSSGAQLTFDFSSLKMNFALALNHIWTTFQWNEIRLMNFKHIPSTCTKINARSTLYNFYKIWRISFRFLLLQVLNLFICVCLVGFHHVPLPFVFAETCLARNVKLRKGFQYWLFICATKGIKLGIESNCRWYENGTGSGQI